LEFEKYLHNTSMRLKIMETVTYLIVTEGTMIVKMVAIKIRAIPCNLYVEVKPHKI